MDIKYTPNNLSEVSDIIIDNLTPDLLPIKYRKRNSTNPMFGHCHHASACLQKIFTSKVLKLHRALDRHDLWHWWVVDYNDNIIDLTSDQYYRVGESPPYSDGKKAYMLGWSYKTRTLELLRRVEEQLFFALN